MFDLVPFRKRNDDFFGQMLKSFNEAFDQNLLSPLDGRTQSFRTDIWEKDNAYFIEAELPGFSKEDIEIDVNDKYLTIRAKRDQIQEHKDKSDKVIRRERLHGHFVRQFYVENIEDDHIKAKLQDGLLKLEIPKRAKSEPTRKKIGIE